MLLSRSWQELTDLWLSKATRHGKQPWLLHSRQLHGWERHVTLPRIARRGAVQMQEPSEAGGEAGGRITNPNWLLEHGTCVSYV